MEIKKSTSFGLPVSRTRQGKLNRTKAESAAQKQKEIPTGEKDRVKISNRFDKSAPAKKSVSKKSISAPKSRLIGPHQKPIPKDLYKTTSDGKTKKVTFIYDPDNRDVLDNLTLIGSWDKNTGRYTNKWKNSAVPMQMDEKGRWIATVELVDDGAHDWEWGVLADGPAGKQKWAVFEEGNLKFNLKGEKPIAFYAPTTYTRMGATRDGKDVNFKFWAPNADDVRVKMWDDDPDRAKFIPLQKDEKTGMWSGRLPGGWKEAEGKKYAYQIVTSEGRTILKNDPYARYLQGQQRGISELYLHPLTGKEVHKYYKDPALEQQGKDSWIRFARFEIQGHQDAEAAYLILTDDKGKQLDKDALLTKFGKSGGDLARKFHEGKFSDFWLDNVEENGRIKLTRQGDAWATIFNNPNQLPGLNYKFEVHKRGPDGKLHIVGDANADGKLSTDEAKRTGFNDPYSGKISENFGWQRYGIIKEPKFDWKYDDAPRIASQKNKTIIYQLHAGSIFGKAKNVDRSTLKDVIKRLDYFKELGVNTLELMPLNTFEGARDWGYIGTSSFAMSDQYGFVDEDGTWVSGTDAVKRFVDEAHRMGFNVINDVVYNHWGGDYNNLWDIDGKKNPYFDWEKNPRVAPEKSRTIFKVHTPAEKAPYLRGIPEDGAYSSYRDKSKLENRIDRPPLFQEVRHTPWGAMPAFNKEPVRQFIVDNAMAQLDEFHFDGLRFDFTHPIHDPAYGGTEGWKLLRKINRQVHFFHPKAHTVAEEFPNAEIITEPAQGNLKGGAGFDAMWNTQYQHELVHDHNGSAVLQQAAKGWKTDIDSYMNHLVHHPGFTNHMNSVTVISNHDEVGNADRTINVATNHQHGTIPNQWARNSARTAFGLGMLSPGMPIFFQGEESLATNQFKWGVPSTWDVGWDWLDVGKNWDWKKVKIDDSKVHLYKKLLNQTSANRSANRDYQALNATDKQIIQYLDSVEPDKRDQAIYNIMRKAHYNFCRDVIKLRQSSCAFDGDAEVHRVYTHNANSVLAFTRKKGDQEYLVIGSFNKNNLQDYNIPLQGGKWQLVFNSDADYYGGENYGSKIHVDGNPHSRFDIPKGGMLVYKRVS